MLALSQTDNPSYHALEFRMRDTIGAIEELSLNTLFSMDCHSFEILSIEAEVAEQPTKATLSIVQ